MSQNNHRPEDLIRCLWLYLSHIRSCSQQLSYPINSFCKNVDVDLQLSSEILCEYRASAFVGSHLAIVKAFSQYSPTVAAMFSAPSRSAGARRTILAWRTFNARTTPTASSAATRFMPRRLPACF